MEDSIYINIKGCTSSLYSWTGTASNMSSLHLEIAACKYINNPFCFLWWMWWLLENKDVILAVAVTKTKQRYFSWGCRSHLHAFPLTHLNPSFREKGKGGRPGKDSHCFCLLITFGRNSENPVTAQAQISQGNIACRHRASRRPKYFTALEVCLLTSPLHRFSAAFSDGNCIRSSYIAPPYYYSNIPILKILVQEWFQRTGACNSAVCRWAVFQLGEQQLTHATLCLEKINLLQCSNFRSLLL